MNIFFKDEGHIRWLFETIRRGNINKTATTTRQTTVYKTLRKTNNLANLIPTNKFAHQNQSKTGLIS